MKIVSLSLDKKTFEGMWETLICKNSVNRNKKALPLRKIRTTKEISWKKYPGSSKGNIFTEGKIYGTDYSWNLLSTICV